jgi:hypothetical protein
MLTNEGLHFMENNVAIQNNEAVYSF